MRAVIPVILILAASARAQNLRPLYDAIRQVETGEHANSAAAVGDGGRSIGPYQIQYAYWLDSRVPGHYGLVRDRAYAERVMRAYWQRYEPAALRRGDFEVLARCHNGGPGWRKHRNATDGYWSRVKARQR
jgi:hypothetical protein